jgi:DNA-binding NtrC family response regulator
VDVRVIAATERDLESEVAAGRFRGALYYRLNVLPIHVPPLRARISDIPLLANRFLQRFAQDNREPVRTLAPEALDALEKHSWPGNVRELESAIHHAVARCKGDSIGAELLKLGAPRKPTDTPKERCADEEDRHLREFYGKRPQRKLARDIGRNVAWVNRRLRRLGLTKPRPDDA